MGLPTGTQKKKGTRAKHGSDLSDRLVNPTVVPLGKIDHPVICRQGCFRHVSPDELISRQGTPGGLWVGMNR
jgi:hypothetical protein